MQTFNFIKSWQVACLYLVLIACDTFSQILFKAASIDIGPASLSSWASFFGFVEALLFQPTLAAGLLLLLIAFCCWMLLISHADLSKAHLISCTAYATVPLCSVFIFSDYLSNNQLLGILLITLGAAISSIETSTSVE
jgi:drug/metabolite transporter (DMT)-like permease